jgi:hypothetical protein
VALAYREAKIEGRTECVCFERAWAVFAAEEPERARDRSAGSDEVYRLICSAINADPEWFWAPVPIQDDGWRR